MPKIKWVGIIKNPCDYQKDTLSVNAKKLDMPTNMSEMMIKAAPFSILPILILFTSMYVKTFRAGTIVVSPLFMFIGALMGFCGILIHEFLHAIVYPKQATVYIGIMPKQFAAVALASYPLKRGRFILMSLLPLVLGIIPIFIFWITPSSYIEQNGFCFGLSMMGLVSPYPDLYNVFQVLKQTGRGCKLQFYEDDLYSIENVCGGSPPPHKKELPR